LQELQLCLCVCQSYAQNTIGSFFPDTVYNDTVRLTNKVCLLFGLDQVYQILFGDKSVSELFLEVEIELFHKNYSTFRWHICDDARIYAMMQETDLRFVDRAVPPVV